MDTRIFFVFCAFAIASINGFVKCDVISDMEQDPEIAEAPTGVVDRLKYCYSETLAHTVNTVKKDHLQPLLNFFEQSWNKIRRVETYNPVKYDGQIKRVPVTWEDFQNDLKEFRKCFRQTVAEILDDFTETGLQPVFRSVEDHLGKLTRVVDILTASKEMKPSENPEQVEQM
ncbi:uncharacterized protein LOC119839515 [Zerene cesonia]|uniref:uncharacterized protein LOC119839515 n=1 Tax=Zerene cesonia TaxID=33412 RepID=UPI0018E53FCA|nr:uncharacterized protein LOC119839515 [Zerene cesonia]